MTIINRAYKTELKPNNKQVGYFRQCCGTARFVYNWALADRIRRFEENLPTNLFEQKRRFNALKREQISWIYEIPYTVQEEEFRNLDSAYKNFFRRIKNGGESGFPNFKKKGMNERFSLRGSIHIESDKIKLPRIGWVNLKEKGYLPKDGQAKINKVTISERAGRWFVSVQCEIESKIKQHRNGNVIGIDPGLHSAAVISNGKIFDPAKALRRYEKRLARLQRELSRRQKGSNNRAKTKQKIARLHFKIANVRKHNQHEISSYIPKTRANIVVVETLNVKGMLKNRKMAKSVSDAGMSELLRQIGYKAAWSGMEVIKADMWYASTKTCSKCGNVKSDITLQDRVYKCNTCGLVIDRDLNAAKNLAALGEPLNGRGLPVELSCSNAAL